MIKKMQKLNDLESKMKKKIFPSIFQVLIITDNIKNEKIYEIFSPLAPETPPKTERIVFIASSVFSSIDRRREISKKCFQIKKKFLITSSYQNHLRF